MASYLRNEVSTFKKEARNSSDGSTMAHLLRNVTQGAQGKN